jgi:hypothetical protein
MGVGLEVLDEILVQVRGAALGIPRIDDVELDLDRDPTAPDCWVLISGRVVVNAPDEARVTHRKVRRSSREP